MPGCRTEPLHMKGCPCTRRMHPLGALGCVDTPVRSQLVPAGQLKSVTQEAQAR